mgnify:CR=1 FL=1
MEADATELMQETYLKFRRPGRKCLLCGGELPAEGTHASVLNLSESEEALREDICPECWGRMGEKNYFSFWITKRFQEGPSAEQRRLAKAERNEALWALFNVLYAQKNPDLAPQLFLVAHLLMKYRILAYAGTTEEGMLQFDHAPTQETFLVPDLPLDAVSFVDVKQAIDAQLHEHAPPESNNDDVAEVE